MSPSTAQSFLATWLLPVVRVAQIPRQFPSVHPKKKSQSYRWCGALGKRQGMVHRGAPYAESQKWVTAEEEGGSSFTWEEVRELGLSVRQTDRQMNKPERSNTTTISQLGEGVVLRDPGVRSF